MFTTERQKEILDAQKPISRSNQIPHRRLGVSSSTVNSINTEIFQNFIEALEVMADQDNLDTFRGRFKKHKDHVWALTREIRSNLNKI